MVKNIVIIVLSIASLVFLFYGFDQHIEAVNNMELAIINADSTSRATENKHRCEDKNDSLQMVILDLQKELEGRERE